MKKIKVFIDCFGGQPDRDFARRLARQISSVVSGVEVSTFLDLAETVDEDSLSSDAIDACYQDLTVREISEATIVIPIVTSSYLPHVTEKIKDGFNQILISPDRYLFSVLLGEASWSNLHWVVKSRLFPADEVPLVDRSSTEIDKTVNDLVSLIEGIVAERSSLLVSPFDSVAMAGEDGLIFISHDHDDADFAELLKLRLEKHGLKGWIDSERLKAGQSWREEIDKGLEDSLAVVVVMTPDARKSEYVTYEWAYAWGKGKKIIPIMLKQTQLHPRLESLQYLDFTNRVSRPWDGLISIINSLG